MNVASSTRRKALLYIFRMYRKRRGGCLAEAELERNWRPTGLRRDDLQLGLGELVEAHLLNVRRSAAGVVYELSYMGERTMHAAVENPVDAVRDWLTLGRARRRSERRPGTAPPARPRRRTDSGRS